MTHDADKVCPCVAEHVPKAVELHRHHLLPSYLGGGDTDDNLVWICPNTHAATHELLRLYLRAGGPPHHDVINDYPRHARVLALKAWRLYLGEAP